MKKDITIETLQSLGFVMNDSGEYFFLSKEVNDEQNCLHKIIISTTKKGTYIFSIARTGESIVDCIDLFETATIVKDVNKYMKLCREFYRN